MSKEYIRSAFSFGSAELLPPFLLFDDFQSLNGWDKLHTGDSVIRRVLTPTIFPASSAELKTRTTSPATGDQARIRHYFPFPLSYLVSIMVLWRFNANFNNPGIGIEFIIFDGTTRHKFGVRYLFTDPTNRWQYLDENDTYSNLSLLTQPLELGNWYKTILTVDIRAKTYRRLISQNSNIDISSLTYKSSASTSIEAPLVVLSADSVDVAAPQSVFFNKVLLLETPIESF